MSTNLVEAYYQFQVRFKPLADVIYQPVDIASQMIGLPADEGRIGICLLVTFVLNLIMSHIHSPAVRKIYSTSLGLLIANYVYGASFLLVIPYSMIGYICMHVAPRVSQHIVTMVIGGLLLTSFNFYAQMQDEMGYNSSMLAMVYFVKMSIITINYRDGAGDLDKVLTEREMKYRLLERPILSEYCHYIFGLPSCLVGPPYEYKDWFDFIERQN